MWVSGCNVGQVFGQHGDVSFFGVGADIGLNVIRQRVDLRVERAEVVCITSFSGAPIRHTGWEEGLHICQDGVSW